MKKLITRYEELCLKPSDINEHLPTLFRYSRLCDHVTEFGVRGANSTYALLRGMPKKMISYDINHIDLNEIKEDVKLVSDFNFIQANTLEVDIEATNLLFIDTLHNYDQLIAELNRHSSKVENYIILHDTTSYEWTGEVYSGAPKKGLWPAVEEFLNKNPHWIIKERFTNNNGLTILKRI